MGRQSEALLKPAPAFNHVMLDMFEPYAVGGEVQKRTTVKTYGVIFTDLVMMAVHIEVMFAYDTSSFLMALSRFASVLGWEEIIYSDHGSELVERNGNSGKLVEKESTENPHIRRARERINLGVWSCR